MRMAIILPFYIVIKQNNKALHPWFIQVVICPLEQDSSQKHTESISQNNLLTLLTGKKEDGRTQWKQWKRMHVILWSFIKFHRRMKYYIKKVL